MNRHYTVVANTDLTEFILAVNTMIEEGWIPQGGIAVSTEIQETEGLTVEWYYQAMFTTAPK